MSKQIVPDAPTSVTPQDEEAYNIYAQRPVVPEMHVEGGALKHAWFAGMAYGRHLGPQQPVQGGVAALARLKNIAEGVRIYGAPDKTLLAKRLDDIGAALALLPAQPAPGVWPFVETPGAFTERLAVAYQQFGNLLAAVRCVLIEQPPQLAAQPAPQAQGVDLIERNALIRDVTNIAEAAFYMPQSWHERVRRLDLSGDTPPSPVAQPEPQPGDTP